MLRKFLFANLALGFLFVAAPAAHAGDKAFVPFNGKTLHGWVKKRPTQSHWTVGNPRLNRENPRELEVLSINTTAPGALINAKGRGVDIYTENKFGDCRIELEVMVPKGSNSGIYVQGEYEVQVLDSYGKKKIGPGDIGALYGAAPPRVNASKKPGEWQKFVIDFQAPRFKDGKKKSNAKFLAVTLNGKVLHENVEMKGPTPGGVTGREHATGPIMFQGNHGPVAFRNIKVFRR